MKHARLSFFALGALAPVALIAIAACGGKAATHTIDPGGPAFDGAVEGRATGPYHPDASCPVTIDTPPLLDGIHVPIGSEVLYNSNPPSSGPHYPIWAAYQEFTTPVDRRYYVHNIEHGAVVLLYKCDADAGEAGDGGDGGTACDALVEGLRKAAAAIETDPLCDQDAGVRVRVVITRDPFIPTPIAATAWGNTYTAACVDLPTLSAFAKAHYGHGSEISCANGISSF